MPETKTIDLRGSDAAPAQGATVLADPTGRRARRMRLGGRLVAATFALWMGALVLAGLGVLPSNAVPLAGELRPGATPPKLAVDDALASRTGKAPALRPIAATPTPTVSGRAPITPAATAAPEPERSARPQRTPTPRSPVATRTPRPRNPNAATPHDPAATPIAPGNSTTAPGRVRTPRPKATPAPTTAATPAPTPTPRPHGGGKTN